MNFLTVTDWSAWNWLPVKRSCDHGDMAFTFQSERSFIFRTSVSPGFWGGSQVVKYKFSSDNKNCVSRGGHKCISVSLAFFEVARF